jgi:CheY-like chemotaxis protein
VVLTAYAGAELRAEALRHGAVELWPKTLPIPELLERLRALGLPLGARGEKHP